MPDETIWHEWNPLHQVLKVAFVDGVAKPKVPPLPPVTVPDDVLRSALGVLNPKRPPRRF